MKLGTKIAGGFTLLILIAMGLGAIAIFQMNSVQVDSKKLADEYAPEAEHAGELVLRSYTTMYAMRGYGLTFDQGYLDAGNAGLKTVDETMADLQELSNKSDLKGLEADLPKIKEAIKEYKTLKDTTEEINVHMTRIRGELDTNAGNYMASCAKYLAGQNEKMQKDYRDPEIKNDPKALDKRLEKIKIVNDVIDIGNATRIAVFKAQADRELKHIIDAEKENFPKMATMFARLRELSSSPADHVLIKDIDEAANGYKDAINEYIEESNELTMVSSDRGKAGDEVVKLATNLSTLAMEQTNKIAKDAESNLSSAIVFMLIGLTVALVVGIVLAVVITKSITGPINNIIGALDESSGQVEQASGQISSASQSLAEGATEQAASLEESSSALEQMASMTRQNADNAQGANTMMQDTQAQVGQGANAVKNMATAMEEINDSSDQISKIIKTIEEIAFQTNLLALNAAVEAARAGDAGKGFAVVADEVRNLAQRSAQAARDTAELIEGTVERVKNGTAIVSRLETSFGEVQESAGKVAGLVAEISSASQEQAQGVDQVNTAVAQMDKVTQSNAANAEESASASEELSAQAGQLKSVVGDLVALVSGAGGDGGAQRQQGGYVAKRSPVRSQPAQRKQLSAPSSTRAPKMAGPSVVKANDVIPFDDDDDFSDF